MLDQEILHHKYHSLDRSEISSPESRQHQNRRMYQRKHDLVVALCRCTCTRPVYVGLVAIASNLHQLATTIRALEEHGMALEAP